MNKEADNKYGNQVYDYKKGALQYNGIEHYGIALGPTLQNPNINLNKGLSAYNMAYGTCVDISISLNNKTYYIQAIIVDTKEHTAPTGIFQTGLSFDGDFAGTPNGNNLVEWYTDQFTN